MISSITNRGRLAFMIFRERFTAQGFVNFLRRLLRLTRKTRRKVDGQPAHKSRLVNRWLAEHAARIRVFRLPAYSPELNPDELLNQDVKTNLDPFFVASTELVRPMMLVCKASAQCVAAALSKICMARGGRSGREGEAAHDPRVPAAKGGRRRCLRLTR